jgi:hypothetical protein
MSNTIKVVLVAVVIILIGGFGYWYATSSGTQAPQGTLQTTSTVPTASPLNATDTAISDKFLVLLLNMRTIKLDQSIFSDEAFASLKDFSTTITPETNPGRANPFAPIGVDAAPVQNLVVTTNQAGAVTKNAATFSGSVPAGTVVTKRYFEYSTTATPPFANTTVGVPGDAATGGFSFSVSSLTPNTTYYYRAAVVAGGTTTYGSVMSFKTLAQ